MVQMSAEMVDGQMEAMEQQVMLPVVEAVVSLVFSVVIL